MPARTDSFVLDTFAVIAYLTQEKGSDAVRDILLGASKGASPVFLSFATLTELYYVALQRQAEAAARVLVVHIKTLPLNIVYPTERMALSAGRLKTAYRLSLADAFIAATAIEKEARLVHKNPELEAVYE